MNRSEKRWLKHINTKIADGRPAAEFAVLGKTDAGLTANAKIGIGLFAGLMVTAFLFGYIIFPGGLFLVWLHREMKPPRLVTVSAYEISSFAQGSLNNKPKTHVAAMPLVPLQPSNDGAKLRIGSEVIAFKKKEYQRLVDVSQGMMRRPQGSAAVPTHPTAIPQPARVPAMAAPTPQIFS